MSKKCPKCGSNNVHLAATVPHALCVCFDCRHQWKNKYKPRKKTVFQKITASPEVLAPQFVYHVTSFFDGLDKPKKIWYSTLINNQYFNTELEAKRATVAKLKEVEK